jgi:hypothetical protein
LGVLFLPMSLDLREEGALEADLVNLEVFSCLLVDEEGITWDAGRSHTEAFSLLDPFDRCTLERWEERVVGIVEALSSGLCECLVSDTARGLEDLDDIFLTKPNELHKRYWTGVEDEYIRIRLNIIPLLREFK